MTITLIYKELLHDIETIAASISDALGKDGTHTPHLVADVGADDVTWRRRRLTDLAVDGVVEALTAYGCRREEEESGEEDYVDMVTPGYAYVLTLDAAEGLPATARGSIARLAHEYVAHYVIFRWLLIVAPELAPPYSAIAERTLADLRRQANRRVTPIRRGHTPI